MTDDIDLLTDVSLVTLDSLVPYANNPKNHPEEQVTKISKSIRRYGMDQPIVVDADGEIIKGHGRFQASQKLGLEQVPVIWRDGLKPEEVKGARIADNKTSLESGFDYDELAGEFTDLDEYLNSEDISDMTGFEETDVSDMIKRGGTELDDFEALPDRDTSDDGSSDGSVDAGDAGGTEDVDGDAARSDVDSDGERESMPSGMFECPDCGHEFDPSTEEGQPDAGEDESDA